MEGYVATSTVATVTEYTLAAKADGTIVARRAVGGDGCVPQLVTPGVPMWCLVHAGAYAIPNTGRDRACSRTRRRPRRTVARAGRRRPM
jgi:hypothetical protein